MPQINQLSAVDRLAAGDNLPVYDESNGDARKAAMSVLLDYVQENLVFPDASPAPSDDAVRAITLAAGSAAATVNTDTLQAQLDAAGYIHVHGEAGDYYINDTLIVHSDTTLVIVPGVKLKQADNTNLLMVQNYALTAPSVLVLISWTAGVSASVTWVNHGLTTDDYVCFQGAVQGEYNNIFRVHEVVDVNTFVVRLYRTPSTTATGTITGKVCDKNIHIRGLNLDYNFANNASAAQSVNRHACVLAFIAKSSVRQFKAANVYKYGLNTCADADCIYEQISGTNVAEIFKHYGPSVACVAHGIYGQSTDDCTSIQAKEPAAFIAYQPAVGDVISRELTDVHVTSNGAAAAAVVVYASTDETITGIKLRNINSFAKNGSGIAIKNGSTFTGTIGTIQIDGIRTAGKAVTNYAISVSCHVNALQINCAEPQPNDTATSMYKQEAGTTVRYLEVNNFRFDNTSWPSPSAGYIFNLNGDCDVATFRGGYVTGNSQARFLSVGAGTVYEINIEDMSFNSISMLGIMQAGAGNTRTVNMRGCRVKSITSGFDVRSLTKFVLVGNSFDTLPSGVIRPTTTAGLMTQIYGFGNSFTSATLVAASNSATWESYSYDVAVDPITAVNLAATVGQYLVSTQAGIEGGPAIRTPAGWVALGTGAAGVNTVIT